MSEPGPAALQFHLVVEGELDLAVGRRLIQEANAELGRAHVTGGKAKLLKNLAGYNRAARHAHWLVIVDLDADAPCAPLALPQWLPAAIERKLCLRVAVREVEAWLLSDHEGLASFLGIRTALVPRLPEELRHPKREVVRLAGCSRRREVRKALVPGPSSGRVVGPEYRSFLERFIAAEWNPARAATRSPSLRRAVTALGSLREATV